MLKDTIEIVKDLAIVSSGVIVAGVLTRPYRGFKRALADAASIFFITQVGGIILKERFYTESIAYATAAVIGYFAPYIIDLITTFLVELTRDIEKCDFSKVIQKRLGGDE